MLGHWVISGCSVDMHVFLLLSPVMVQPQDATKKTHNVGAF